MKTICLTVDVTAGYGVYYQRLRMLPVSKEWAEDIVNTAHTQHYLPIEDGKWILGVLTRRKTMAMFTEGTIRPVDFILITASSPVSIVAKDKKTNECICSKEYYNEGGYPVCPTSEISILSEIKKQTRSDSLLLLRESRITEGRISFEIQIPEHEQFDVEKLRFMKINTNDFKEKSKLFNDMLAGEICYMNAIEYDNQMYIGTIEEEYIYVYRNTGTEFFDITNSELKSMAPDLYK